jgi:hypothetical protein
MKTNKQKHNTIKKIKKINNMDHTIGFVEHITEMNKRDHHLT